LNVSSKGAKPIYRYGTTSVGTTPEESWYAGQVVSFTYSDGYWRMNDWQDGSKVAQTNTTTSSDYRVLLSGSANDTTTTEGANKSGNLTFNPSTKELEIAAGGHIKTNGFYAPTTSGGSTYGAGTSGQVLTSNGTTTYWADAPAGAVVGSAIYD
jgi:hypothetical protein